MKKGTRLVWTAPLALVLFATGGCGKATDASGGEDSSASGVAASAASGALSSSDAGATFASYAVPKTSVFTSVRKALDFLPEALASVACPTYKTSQGSGCTSAGSTLWLSYVDCSFGGAATWNGTQALTMSSGSANCGTFPRPGASQSLTRQYVSGASSTTPSTITRTSRFGTTVTIDDASSNLKNFDSDTISTIANGGYGTQVGFNSSGLRNSVTIAHRIYVTKGFDHSVSGQLSVSESSGASTRTMSGSIKVYHNILKVVGTSTFNDVVHSNDCCFPTAGSITTAFSAGSNVSPTQVGSAWVGKSETLTFTGCGTGTLQGVDGSTANVTLSHCF